VLIFYVLGEIWFFQIVVYPLFGKVGEEEYVAYHRFYSSRIPLLVIVPGFASFLLTIPLVFFAPDSVPTWRTRAGGAHAAGLGVGLLDSRLEGTFVGCRISDGHSHCSVQIPSGEQSAKLVSDWLDGVWWDSRHGHTAEYRKSL
jgi:hypothetical protein